MRRSASTSSPSRPTTPTPTPSGPTRRSPCSSSVREPGCPTPTSRRSRGRTSRASAATTRSPSSRRSRRRSGRCERSRPTSTRASSRGASGEPGTRPTRRIRWRPSDGTVGARTMRVGFIGLGDMGGAMAQCIIDAGYETVLWARRPEVLSSFEGERVETADSPADLAAHTDLVCVCVWTDDDVREVLGGERGVLAGARPDTIVAVHSTVAPATCRELADEAARRDVTLLDVPVSGGRDVALAGNLAVAIGGDEDAAERCRPVFETYGDPVLHVGPVGAAQAVKLINNALLSANLAVADDALTVGAALGIRTEAMQQLLRSGSGRSYALDVVIGARGSPEMRAAARPALEKDVHALAAAVAGEEADAALLLRAAEEAVARLGDPPPDWTP